MPVSPVRLLVPADTDIKLGVTLMGFVQSFSDLLIARMMLGLTEGGLFPGVAYYITLWYRRHETGFRMAIFFSAATLAGAFGGLLATGISSMDGLGGRPGWSWIFIVEGLVTIGVALVAKFIIMDDHNSYVSQLATLFLIPIRKSGPAF